MSYYFSALSSTPHREMEEMLNEKTMQIEENKQEAQSTTNTDAELPTKPAEGVQPENPSKNRRGIVFISNIPLGLNPSLVKQKLSEIGTITRIHLEPKSFFFILYFVMHNTIPFIYYSTRFFIFFNSFFLFLFSYFCLSSMFNLYQIVHKMFLSYVQRLKIVMSIFHFSKYLYYYIR